MCVRSHYSKTIRPSFTSSFVHAAHGRGSVLPRRRCDMLCISGFTDDVRFSYHGTYRRVSLVAAGGMQAAVGRLAH